MSNKYQFNDMHTVMLAKKVHDSIGGTSDAPPATLESAHYALNHAWDKPQTSKLGMFAHSTAPALPINPPKLNNGGPKQSN